MIGLSLIVGEAIPDFSGHIVLQVSIFIFFYLLELALINHTFSMSMILILHSVYSRIQ